MRKTQVGRAATKSGESVYGGRKRMIIVAVVLVFSALLAWKAASAGVSTPSAGSTGAESVTSVRNDALRDYDAALESGKPVYVLFHSLTCDPCVQISTVADDVLPAYDGKIVFVNAITDDPGSQRLASKFSFQYIPTSFFLSPDGEVTDSYTGAMSEGDLRARLDRLVEGK